MQPPTRGRPTQPGRGRPPARWTGLELTLILLSAVMIAYPLFAGTVSIIAPPLAPAQELPPTADQPATDTPDPAFPLPPTDTAVPPPPTDTAIPPPPTDTAVPAIDQVATNTTRPATPTSTIDPSTPTSTVPVGDTPTATVLVGDTPTPSSTSDPNISPTPSSTSDPNISPTPTLTQGPTTGVRVFKVASVSEASVGQNFSYSVSVITDSATDQQVSMSDGLDANLEVLSASSGSGSCTTGQTVSCNLTLRADNPASVTIQVRVRAGVTVGTNISNSASAGSASSGSVNVRVVGGGGTPLPSPTGPTITPSPSPTGPTITPSPSPTGPTLTPTNTPVTPVATTPSLTPTNRPVEPPPQPKPEPEPPRENRPSSTEVPPAPPAPPTPIPGVPTEPPTPDVIIFDPGQPQVRPTAAVRPTRVPQGPTRTASPLIPLPTGSAQPTSGTSGPAGGGGTDIFFRLASDWGSAYPGQQVNFTLAVRNTRAPAAAGANDLRTVTVRSALPGNLELLGARADRGSDPAVNGNEVSYSIPLLQPGEGVEITVETRIRPDVTVGTLLVAQGQLTYEGLAQTAFSNIVSVQVVGNAQPPTAAAGGGSPVAQAATGTTAPYPPPGTGTPVRTTATPVRTITPTVAGQAPQPTAPPTLVPPRPPAPLPETSAGVPMLGIALLGGTLLTRTWRIHRSKSRL